MKLMVLSDLHLGKKLNEFSLIDDQKHILEQLLRLMDEHKPDGLIIAGDVYDKSIPTAEAVRLLDWFIQQVVVRQVQIFMISGNHDSADRLAFGANLFKAHAVHIAPGFREPLTCIPWSVGDVTAHLYLLPFIRPVQVRAVWPDKEITSYDDAVRAVIEETELDQSVVNILVAHQFIAGASVVDSDDLIIGGLDQVDARIFHDFDLVTLGHLHRGQTIGRDNVRYAGSPLKYSFSEASLPKSLLLITIHSKEQIETVLLPLIPLRDMRIIKGPFSKITEKEVYQVGNQADYVHITLTDEHDIPDALNRLRAIYPNVMKLSYDNLRTSHNQSLDVGPLDQMKSPLEVFSDFFELQNNQPMDERQAEYIQGLFDELEVKR